MSGVFYGEEERVRGEMWFSREFVVSCHLISLDVYYLPFPAPRYLACL